MDTMIKIHTFSISWKSKTLRFLNLTYILHFLLMDIFISLWILASELCKDVCFYWLNISHIPSCHNSHISANEGVPKPGTNYVL